MLIDGHTIPFDSKLKYLLRKAYDDILFKNNPANIDKENDEGNDSDIKIGKVDISDANALSSTNMTLKLMPYYDAALSSDDEKSNANLKLDHNNMAIDDSYYKFFACKKFDDSQLAKEPDQLWPVNYDKIIVLKSQDEI